MTNSVNYQNQAIPAYSGITINITNPTVNPPSAGHVCQPGCRIHNQNLANNNDGNMYTTNPTQPINPYMTQYGTGAPNENIAQAAMPTPNPAQYSYPPQYYLNNYNYVQNGEKGNAKSLTETPVLNNIPPQNDSKPIMNTAIKAPEEDMNASKEIIDNLDSKLAEQKELEANGQEKRVVALTNEYIMSLENYLNNPNSEIRLMAAKEILTRLDEDKDRYDDVALNALLNKMLQDPEQLIRVAAMSAFSSKLASGNDFTVKLLQDIQNNPNANKDDVVEAANILLTMSAETEIKHEPAKLVNKPTNPMEEEMPVSQEQLLALQEMLQAQQNNAPQMPPEIQ